jgi:hypothetical protein
MQNEVRKTKTAENQKYPLKSQIQEILALITAFSNLLVKETAALKKADFKAVDALQADKKLFAKQYQAKVTALAERREELPGMDIMLREKLIKERLRFNAVLDENMHALEMAQNSTKRLVNRILETARHAITENKETNYSRAGKAMAYKSATLSLAVDRNL